MAKKFTPDELKNRLTPDQYHVTQKKGTEPPFSGEHLDCKDPGVFLCVVCEVKLFPSDTKFDSGTGWPSFHTPHQEENIKTEADSSHGMHRVEVMCNECGAHLGHVFEDGPGPSGKRYCINSLSLKFEEDKE